MFKIILMNSARPIIRPIEKKDIKAIKKVVISVLDSFGANRPGFASQDPELDDLYTFFNKTQSKYWVLENANEEIVGGGGIGPLKGNNEGWCELQKMYFLPTARGFGLGREMIEKCLEFAKETGFKGCYLETLGTMHIAQHLYAQYGFERIAAQKGSTGHSGCDVFMVLKF